MIDAFGYQSIGGNLNLTAGWIPGGPRADLARVADRGRPPARAGGAPASLARSLDALARLPRSPARATHLLDSHRGGCLDSRPHSNMGCERDEYPSLRRIRDPVAGVNRDGDDEEWTREPPDRTDRPRGDALQVPVGSGAERQRYRAAPIGRPRAVPVGHRVRHSRIRVAPRKARPFVPGTNGRF